MYKNYQSEIKSCIPSNWSSFGFSVFAGVVSTFVFTVIAGIFYFMGETSDRNTRDKIKSAIENVQVSPANITQSNKKH